MLETLDINGRIYVSSEKAAHDVGFDERYILRLAKGKWVDASFVQGQCFVNIASLETFLASGEAEVTKRLREVAAREAAEAVWLAHEARVAAGKPMPTYIILGKAGVIVACGILIAVLGLAAQEAGIELADVAGGIAQTAGLIGERFASPAAVVVPVLEWFSS